jgi:hypothetical protein
VPEYLTALGSLAAHGSLLALDVDSGHHAGVFVVEDVAVDSDGCAVWTVVGPGTAHPPPAPLWIPPQTTVAPAAVTYDGTKVLSPSTMALNRGF